MDELTICNRALGATGNRQLTALHDGTDEAVIVGQAFDRGLEDLISQHNWPFARTSADLVATTPNPSQVYAYAHALPSDCLHLRAVFVGGYKTENYEVFGRRVCLDDDSDVSIEYIAEPADADWHPQAAEVLTLMVEAALLRAFNEDFTEATRRDQAVQIKLAQVRPLVNQENGARNAYMSTVAEARYRRRG